jgi:hypothetical protein
VVAARKVVVASHEPVVEAPKPMVADHFLLRPPSNGRGADSGW